MSKDTRLSGASQKGSARLRRALTADSQCHSPRVCTDFPGRHLHLLPQLPGWAQAEQAGAGSGQSLRLADQQEDFNRAKRRRVHRAHRRADVVNALLLEAPGMDHRMPPVEDLATAVTFLGSGRPRDTKARPAITRLVSILGPKTGD